MPCGQGGACQQQMHSSPAQRAASMDVSASLWAPSGSAGGAPARRSSSFTAAGAHAPPIAHARTARDSGSAAGLNCSAPAPMHLQSWKTPEQLICGPWVTPALQF